MSKNFVAEHHHRGSLAYSRPFHIHIVPPPNLLVDAFATCQAFFQYLPCRCQANRVSALQPSAYWANSSCRVSIGGDLGGYHALVLHPSSTRASEEGAAVECSQ